MRKLSNSSAHPLSPLPEEPLVSVVIPTYNRAEFVVDAIKSVLSQTYKQLEVIVIDDGSCDDTAARLELFRGKIRYIYQANQGVAGATNRGIKEATGELIALQHSDDLWEPVKLARQLELLREHPGAGLVYAKANWRDVRTGETGNNFPGPTVDVHDVLALRIFAPSTVMIRREVLDHVGVLDPTLRSAEDWDLWIRIAAEFPIVGCAEPLTTSLFHSANLSGDSDTMFRASLRVARRYRFIHGRSCKQCRKAIASSMRYTRQLRYSSLRNLARRAAKAGRYGVMMHMNLRALAAYPACIASMPVFATRRLLKACAGNDGRQNDSLGA